MTIETQHATKTLLPLGALMPSVGLAPANAIVATPAKTDIVSRTQMQRAVASVRTLEVALAKADAKSGSNFITGVGELSFAIGAIPGAVGAFGLAQCAIGAVVTGIGAALGFEGALETFLGIGMPALYCGAIAAPAFGGYVIPRWFKRAHAKTLAAQLSTTNEADFRALDLARTTATGLQRAVLAVRARAVVDAFTNASGDPSGVTRSATLETLRSIATLRDECTEGELAEATRIQQILGLIFHAGLDTAPTEKEQFMGDGTRRNCGEVRANVAQRMERITGALETLTPEGREVIRPLIEETVVLELASPSERFRLQRFVEALDGKRTRWIPDEGGITTPTGLQIEDMKAAMADPRIRAVRKIAGTLESQAAASSPLSASAVLDDEASARAVAAHFEVLGYRASLFGGAGVEAVNVLVYDPQTPPGPH